jgi:cytidylate kinase
LHNLNERVKKVSQSNLTVAIDGPASSGKSTVAKQIAENLGLIYVDTGAMYRTITYKALQEKVDLQDEAALLAILKETKIEFERTDKGQLVFANGEEVTSDIRQNDVSNAVSDVSAHAAIREELVARQRKIAEQQGVIMDGRDIGTVVLPEADVKIFLVASVEERAERRHNENVQKGIPSDLELLKKEIAERDFKDSNRKVSPLKQAEDALLIDTTELSIQEVVNKIENIIKQKINDKSL